MDRELAKELSHKRLTPLHEALLDKVRGMAKASRNKMKDYFPMWDAQHENYMRRRQPSKEDVEAVRMGNSKKIVVPLGYSQINTAVAFGFMLYTQRERFFEMTPVEDMDGPLRECCESMLQRDNLATDYKPRLIQNILNVCRFGLGAEADWWEEDSVWLPIESTAAPTEYNGVLTSEPQLTTKLTKVIKRSGNSVVSVSPYKLYLDPAFHPTDWKRGSFVGWCESYSLDALMQLQDDGLCTGVEHIDKYNTSTIAEFARETSRISGFDPLKPGDSKAIVVDKMVVNLAPNSIKGRQDGKTLGPETQTHRWIVWIANDNRIIRAEPATNLHGQWPVSISFFAPDHHEAVFNSLSYMIQDLQGFMSWLMNSRVAAVQATVDGQVIADPLGVNLDDISLRKRIIRMQKFAAGKGVERFYKPVEVKDSTQGHVGDMEFIYSLVQRITGVNNNMMGEVASGRRSATENRASNQGASARLKMVFDVMWGQHYQPQANRMLTNLRQQLPPDEFALVCGQTKASYFGPFRADPLTLARAYDYVPFDGTLPTEKLFVAQQLQELLGLLLSNPVTALQFNMNPVRVQEEIMQLRGLGTGKNFRFSPEELQQQMAQLAAQAAAQPQPEGGSSGE